MNVTASGCGVRHIHRAPVVGVNVDRTIGAFDRRARRARGLFTAPTVPDTASSCGTSSVQMGNMLMPTVGARLLSRIHAAAPAVTVRFVAEDQQVTSALRTGEVDVELGQNRHHDPETRVERVLTDPDGRGA